MSGADWSKYEALVAKRWAYYRPRFERFARGGWLSWNWAAFFATLAWLRYRRLHAWSWGYFFLSTPFLLAVLLIIAAGDSCERAIDPGPDQLARAVVLAIIAVGWIVPPLFANRLYYNHVRALAGRNDALASTGGVAGALALQAFVLLGTAVVVPSIGHYVYRSMVSEGVSLAAGAKAPVTEYFEDHKRLPARIEEVAANTSGRYVERLALAPDGTIRATFGEKGRKLAGRGVTFTPVRKDGRIVEWVCRGVDLPDTCLPASCRGNR